MVYMLILEIMSTINKICFYLKNPALVLISLYMLLIQQKKIVYFLWHEDPCCFCRIEWNRIEWKNWMNFPTRKKNLQIYGFPHIRHKSDYSFFFLSKGLYHSRDNMSRQLAIIPIKCVPRIFSYKLCLNASLTA